MKKPIAIAALVITGLGLLALGAVATGASHDRPGAPSRIVREGGFLRDSSSGLLWMPLAGAHSFTHPEAIRYCAVRHMRLPTKAEILGIAGKDGAEVSRIVQAHPNYPNFTETWTSTPGAGTDTWVAVGLGSDTHDAGDNLHNFALCVSSESGRLPESSQGLAWAKEPRIGLTHAAATKYCAEKEMRLPTRDEALGIAPPVPTPVAAGNAAPPADATRSEFPRDGETWTSSPGANAGFWWYVETPSTGSTVEHEDAFSGSAFCVR